MWVNASAARDDPVGGSESIHFWWTRDVREHANASDRINPTEHPPLCGKNECFTTSKVTVWQIPNETSEGLPGFINGDSTCPECIDEWRRAVGLRPPNPKEESTGDSLEAALEREAEDLFGREWVSNYGKGNRYLFTEYNGDELTWVYLDHDELKTGMSGTTTAHKFNADVDSGDYELVDPSDQHATPAGALMNGRGGTSPSCVGCTKDVELVCPLCHRGYCASSSKCDHHTGEEPIPADELDPGVVVWHV